MTVASACVTLWLLSVAGAVPACYTSRAWCEIARGAAALALATAAKVLTDDGYPAAARTVVVERASIRCVPPRERAPCCR